MLTQGKRKLSLFFLQRGLKLILQLASYIWPGKILCQAILLRVYGCWIKLYYHVCQLALYITQLLLQSKNKSNWCFVRAATVSRSSIQRLSTLSGQGSCSVALETSIWLFWEPEYEGGRGSECSKGKSFKGPLVNRIKCDKNQRPQLSDGCDSSQKESKRKSVFQLRKDTENISRRFKLCTHFYTCSRLHINYMCLKSLHWSIIHESRSGAPCFFINVLWGGCQT